MSTQNSWNNSIAAANAAITLNSGTNAVNISTDAAATTLSIGTGGAVKGLTLGSTNSTSASTLQSGSGALAVTSTGGTLTVNSGTGTIGISTDASATTCNFATGGAVKTVQLGTTNTTSATVIKSGSGNIAMNSGLTVDSTGRNYNTVQPCFLASKTADQGNVTGDGTAYTLQCSNEIFDQNNNFDATSTFTAPITGRYFFCFNVFLNSLGAAHNNGGLNLVTTAATYKLYSLNPYLMSAGGGGNFIISGSSMANMTSGDTATISIMVYNGTKTVNIMGSTAIGARTPVFAAYLIC